jgi:nicotinamide-nucleotide amidase
LVLNELAAPRVLQDLVEELRAHKLTVSFAESCTGGRLSASLAEIPGVSDVFLGSVVSYAYQAKVDLLGVSWDTLHSEGAVSDKVASQMARGCREHLKSSWSVAITGIAGPSGGTAEKPVGTVWFAASGPSFDRSEKKVFSGSRVQIQQQSVEFAAAFLLGCLKK